jgi:glycosyltransferase involved in cell wall biosynthesis
MGLRTAHVITSLATGGAEIMLVRLLQQQQAHGGDVLVIGLAEPGNLMPELEATGATVVALDMARGRLDPLAVPKVARELRRFRPDVVQTWMYHSDLIGGLAARFAGNPPVAWGLHISNLSREFNRRGTLLTARACQKVSGWLPSAIVCCAEATRRIHVDFGYDQSRMQVIPNGFDTSVFRPSDEAKGAMRAELGIPASSRLVGMLARFHPQKDHRTFVEAAARVRRERDDVHFLIAGYDCTWENAELTRWIDAAGVRDRMHLVGRRTDVAFVQASLDVACLSSQGGEALPLTIGEAMASGVPCAVTDVGDSARLIGEAGRTAAPKDADGLARGISELLDLSDIEYRRVSAAARRRIEEHYSLSSVSAQYTALHERLVAGRAGWTAREGRSECA